MRIGIGIPGNFISTGYDPSALAYFTAASITSPTVKTAINNFVVGLKAQGLWSKLYTFYPIVGTLSQSSYNLVTPASYQVTWADTPSISSNAISFNGTTQYGNTNFSPIAVPGFNMDDVSFGLWDATGFNNRTEVPMGTTQNVGAERIRSVWFSNDFNILDIMSSDNLDARVVFNGQGIGHWHFQRLSSVTKVFKDGNGIASSGAAGNIGIIPTNKVFIGATSDGAPGANTPALFSQKTYKFFYTGKGLTDSEVMQLNALVNTLNAQLSR